MVLLYLYIYNPPFVFLPKSPKTLLSLLCIPLLFTSEFRNLLFRFRALFLIISVIVLYSFARELISGEFVKLSSNITLYLDIYLLPLIILYFFNLCSLKKDLTKDIIIIGVIACLFTFISILNPSIGDYFRFNLLKTDEFTDLVAFRTFGLAESLTFTYGIIQGTMFCLLLFFSKKNKYLQLFYPFFLISILFNARTGFTPVIIGLIIYLIYYANIKLFMKIFLFVSFVVLIISQISINSDQQKTVEWGLDFFSQITELFSGSQKSESNTFNALFGYMVILPNTDLEWLFGTGDFIFAKNYGPNSDVGYVLQLYYGGVFYLIVLFLIIFWMIKKMVFFKTYNKQVYLFSFILIITTIIVNIKGEIFTTNGFLRLSVLIISYFYIKVWGDKKRSCRI